MYLLGIDLGTSSVKSIIINEKGNIIGSASESYELSIPKAGWAEQNPEDWWNATKKSIKKLGNNDVLSKIQAVSFSGQMHGLVTIDDKGNVIRPAILWNDSRTSEEVRFLNNEIGKKRLIQETGNIAYAGFTAPKLLWMKKHELGNFNKIKKILLPKDYLIYKFTGRFVTDYSDASGTLLLNVKEKKWSEYMLELCEIDLEKLPVLQDSFSKIGYISEEVSLELGLRKECYICPGAADNAAAAIGTGAVLDGACNISIGTSGTILIPSKNFVQIDNSELHSFVHADGNFYIMGCILSAASANKWWNEAILEAQVLADNISDELLGDNEVFFLPYLMGERSPHNDEKIRASFLGMSLQTTRNEMSLAVLEGVAFALRDCLSIANNVGLDIKVTKISGGGANSSLWKKIIANVMNIEIEESDNSEGPSFGAALIAGVSIGAFSSFEQACRQTIKVTKTIKPDPKIVEKYNKKYNKFIKIYPKIKSIFE